MRKIKQAFFLAAMLLPYVLLAQSTETRQLPHFTGLKVGGSFDTYIEQGNQEMVRIEAENVDTKKILTEMEGSTLRLSLEKGEYRNIRVKVYLTYRTLSAVSQSGSGKLTCKSDFDVKSLELGSSGSGGMVLKGNIKTDDLDLGVSGSGGMELAGVNAFKLRIGVAGSGGLQIESGEAKSGDIHVAGSGGLKAFGLKTGTARITVAGSGGVDLSVETSLSGTIAGSGNINYRGNPEIVSSSVAGSGRIRKS